MPLPVRADGEGDARKAPGNALHAVGINFGFCELLPPGHVLGMFGDVDDPDLERQGWAIAEPKLLRKLTQGDDTLNLVLTFGGESVNFDFNFQTDAVISANTMARRAVEEGRILLVLKQA